MKRDSLVGTRVGLLSKFGGQKRFRFYLDYRLIVCPARRAFPCRQAGFGVRLNF